MKRLLIHVEGSTEETFVKELLAPYLHARGYGSVVPRLIGNSRQRFKRGGARPWPAVKEEILRHLKTDPGCYSTTMVDYYGLPGEGDRAWPGRALSRKMPLPQKAEAVEHALADDICSGLAIQSGKCRFIPFVVMHEFEGLLFSDCAILARSMGRTDLATGFQAVRDAFDSPEEINDSPETAPSKRVIALCPEYQKVVMGNIAALDMGLETIKGQCRHFREWLVKLESLADIH
jgi:hypothetical protein